MAKKFIVSGQKRLKGEIRITGAKNHALKIIPSCILSSEKCVIKNLPDIEDVKIMLEILKRIGGQVEYLDPHTVRVSAKNINTMHLPKDLAPKLRASIMFVGPLLARFGEAYFPHPGGDVIGKRPIDIFLDGFKAMGVNVQSNNQEYHLKTGKNGLRGAKIVFRRISVTATENLMMAATLARGTTELIFTAMEPEISALAQFLQKRGARIQGAGTTHIRIDGVKKLIGGETRCIPDRVETGTFTLLAAATKSGLKLKQCDPSTLEVFWRYLQTMGLQPEFGTDWVKIPPIRKTLRAIPEVIIHEYPGFVTDLQAPLTVLLTQSQGISLVHETIYERRLLYTDTLNKMGANIIMCDPHRAVIQGPTQLFGGKITSPDIRAGIALLIAALIAKGRSTIDNVYQIERGYEHIVERLKNVGADIKEINES